MTARSRSVVLLVLIFMLAPVIGEVSAQTAADLNESERSDKITGGHIETAEFEPGQPDLRITLNVPSFRLTLWQNGKEVKSYYIGVGRKEFPIYIGDRQATQVIFNPDWIPPSSDWVREMAGVTPGEVIKASDSRNPLGKVKIPLGDSYLLHQAHAGDVGNLVSHGCVRVPLPLLYDLAEKIISARSAPVSSRRIAAAKRNKRMLVVNLGEPPIPVDINYDTLVVEGGALHIYPDVYGRGTNRAAGLRAELESSHVNLANVDDATIKKMLLKVTRRTQFVVEVSSIEQGRGILDGKVLPLIPRKANTPRK